MGLSFGVPEFSRTLAGSERPVTFANDDEQLVGVLHLPEAMANVDCPAVVILHGFGGHKAGQMFVKLARRLANIGVVAFRIDCRGSGDSAGEFADTTTSRQLSDTLLALELLAALDGVDAGRLGGVGLSMGGSVMSTVAGCHDRLRSLVLWSAASSDPTDIVDRYLSEYAGRPNAPEPYIAWGGVVLNEAFFTDIQAWQGRHIETMLRYGGPVLILHGEADEMVSVEHAHRFAHHYRTRSGSPRTEFETIPGADHVFNAVAWETRVLDRSVAFLEETLR